MLGTEHLANVQYENHLVLLQLWFVISLEALGQTIDDIAGRYIIYGQTQAASVAVKLSPTRETPFTVRIT